jgi:hypothetical protein
MYSMEQFCVDDVYPASEKSDCKSHDLQQPFFTPNLYHTSVFQASTIIQLDGTDGFVIDVLAID